ncbi:hypothetical protein ACEPAH_2985 [Sanghuangporus vaninii]
MATRSIPFSLENELVVFFLAGTFSTCLWGMGCIQLYYYYENSSIDEDKRWIKPYTLIIWILDTIHQGFLIKSNYKFFVTDYGNVLNGVHIDRTIIYIGMGSAVIDTTVQCVFVVRVWRLSNKNCILTGALIIAVIGQIGITLAYAGQAVGLTSVTQLLTTVSTERAMNVTWVITDTFIATVMVNILRKRGVGMKRTDSILHRLILYSIGTGLVTGVIGVAAFIGSELLPNSMVYIFPDLLLPKLYLNCLLASLNARVGLREKLVGDAGCTSLHFTGPPIAVSVHSITMNNFQVPPPPSPRTIDYHFDTNTRPSSDQQRDNVV